MLPEVVVTVLTESVVVVVELSASLQELVAAIAASAIVDKKILHFMSESFFGDATSLKISGQKSAPVLYLKQFIYC